MDEDLEFRDMVLKKMEESGSLLGVKANLRALLYDIIENEHSATGDVNDESDLSSSTFEKDSENQLDGKSLAFELMLDTLNSLNLQYTKKILLAETGYRSANLSREQLMRQFGIDVQQPTAFSFDQPALMTLINKVRDEIGENSSELGIVSGSKQLSATATEDIQISAQNDAIDG
ncbi:uncharacterized protein LOC128723934 [Anopheles nili]|uniref:uncharacterized protein LOC128723934 n=1 Tax=Anopheles nili TaxID=185578 RepID=UPI00237BF01E|nr:uncharacterized protein LOC128723934 [Anopheles nili]